MRLLILAILLMAGLAAMSCNDFQSQRDIDEEKIQDYIDDRGIDAESTPDGLYYVIDEPGGDEKPDLSDDITIIYTGRLLDDTIFDSSGGNTVTFPLQNLIRGWQEGIPLFGRGGSGMLIVPSYMGYGSQGIGSIPPNSVLVFDIELVDFE